MNVGITAVGYVLAGFLFFIGMGLREDLGRAKEECNTRMATAVAEAERVTREATQRALERRMRELDAMVQDAREAVALANIGRADAESEAIAAQTTIDRLIQEAESDEGAPLPKLCLVTEYDSDTLDAIRMQ